MSSHSLKQFAGISIDVDPVHTHLQGYGVPFEQRSERPVYDIAIPRALAALAIDNAKATFFFVADDVSNHSSLLKQVVNLFL